MAARLRTRGPRTCRVITLGIVLVAGLFSGGCLVVSLQPIYDEHTIEFDEALVGTWVDPGGEATVIFERGAWNAYRVTVREGTKESVFTAYRTRIGSAVFLDVSPEAGVEPAPLLVPGHAIFRIESSATQVKARALDYDWFADAAETGRLGALTAAFDSRRDVVLAAKTAALRDWLAAHMKEQEMFADEVELTKKKEEKKTEDLGLEL